MTEHPITLPEWGIRALDHGKSQFRVPLVPQLPNDATVWVGRQAELVITSNGQSSVRALPWRVGDVLWCREEWAHDAATNEQCRAAFEDVMAGSVGSIFYGPYYRPTDTGGPYSGLNWRPADTMPRWVARHVLTVTGLRVERVGDISEADAIAEGFGPYANSQTIDCNTESPKQVYRRAWQADHPDHPWPDSWALVTEFEKWQQP